MTTVENNCGSVKKNYGEVKMLGGTVDLNGESGSVIFGGAAGDGSVVCNKGKITVTDTQKTVTIDSNEGIVTINGGEVTVRENTGTILLMNNATLHCTDNVVCRRSPSGNDDDAPDGYPPEADEDTTDENGVSPFVWIAAGAALIACGAVVLFIAKRRKNK